MKDEEYYKNLGLSSEEIDLIKTGDYDESDFLDDPMEVIIDEDKYNNIDVTFVSLEDMFEL